jgi:EpsI family protein
MHSPLNCLPGSGWQPLSSGRQTIQIAGAAPIEVNRYLIQKGGESMLVLYWYQSHGRVIASEYWGKYYMVADAIRMNRTDAALVRVIVPIGGTKAAGEHQAEATGVEFVRALFPLLARHLPA